MMELNAKSCFLWDWENLVMLNTKVSEAPKKLQLVDSEIDGIEGFEVGFFDSSTGRSDGGSRSDLGYASSSKSSKSRSGSGSGSIDSSIYKDLRGSNNSLGMTRTSPTIESSIVSSESLIALELGKRTYFEDDSRDSNVKNGSRKSPSDAGCKKSRCSLESPCCQVEGCNLDLSSAKDYHRKHRVCESHAKSPKVVIKGVERRFCQQCSRFHGLSEFDQKKRSCRMRLSDHNARRRKPKPEVIQFNTMRLTSSLYEGRNQLNFTFDQVPMLQNKHGTWDGAKDSNVTLEKHGFLSTKKSEGTMELHSTHNGPQNSTGKASHVSAQSIPSKGVTSDAYQRGLSVSVAPSNTAPTQDFRALSLLSTSSWGPHDPEPSTLTPLTQPLTTMNVVPLGNDPSIMSDFWHSDHQLANSGLGS